VAALREEAAAIRRNLEEMAADRAMGVITRAQMLAATERGNVQLDEIAGLIAEAARENVLASLVAASDVAVAWQEMEQSRQRAVIRTLMTITLRSPGRGARSDFDPATVNVTWSYWNVTDRRLARGSGVAVLEVACPAAGECFERGADPAPHVGAQAFLHLSFVAELEGSQFVVSEPQGRYDAVVKDAAVEEEVHQVVPGAVW
jgi:hypothetical protein